MRWISKGLDEATPNLRVLADETGVSWFSMRAYRSGERVPTPPTMLALSRVLRNRARRLTKFADRLEATSRKKRR